MATYSFIAAEKAEAQEQDQGLSIAQYCKTLEVSRSGFYDWAKRGPCERDLYDGQLSVEIEAIYIASNRTYGAPRVHHWLARQGYQVSRKRVARIMAENNWTGECGRRKVRTTVVDAEAKPADDLVRQDFNPVEPNSTWCGDVTYIATGEGWLYLATVIDLFSRRVIGWSLAEHMRASLVANALSMASARRGGQVAGVIFHSDRASQYTSAEFGGLCEHLGVRQSMGRIGTAFDNAAAEAFFATLKKELVHRYWWPQRSDARSAVVSWIEGWYNTRRLHSSLRYRTPIEAETDWEASQVRTRRDGRLAA